MTGYGPAHTSRSAEATEITTNVTQRWKAQTGSAVRSDPAVNDGHVYVGSTDGSVYAYDIADGREQWRFRTGGAVRSTPAVVNETVYVTTENNTIYALDSADGTIRWSVAADSQVYGSPVVTDGAVYVASYGGTVCALDSADGAEQWNVSTNGAVTGAPAVSGDQIYIGQYDGTVAAFDTTTGTRNWQVSTGGRIAGATTVADGRVYVGSTDSRVYALDTQTGDTEWQFETGGGVYGSVAVADGRVFAPSNDNRLYALTADTGSEVWNYSTDAGLLSAPTVVGNTVYTAGTDDRIYALSIQDGTAHWRRNLGSSVRSAPAVAGNTLYIGTETGAVYALEGMGTANDTGGIRIVTDPETVYVNQSVQLYANELGAETGINNWTWSFGDNTTARGQLVSHTYDKPGTYTITLTGQTDDGQQVVRSEQVEINAGSSNVYDVQVEPVIYGTPTESVTVPEGVPINLSYHASVSQPDRTANVTFQLGNQSYTDTDGSDGWQYRVPVSELNADQNLTVIAYRDDGTRAVAGTRLDIVDSPAWFQRLSLAEHVDNGPVVMFETTFPSGGTNATLTVPDEFPFGAQVEMPVVGSSQSSKTAILVRIRVNLGTTESTVTVSGSQSYQLTSTTNITGSISGTGYFLLREMDLTDARAQAEISAEAAVPPSGIPNPLIGPVPPGVVRLYPIFGAEVPATVYFDETDTANSTDVAAFTITNGNVQPNLYAQQEVGQKWEAFEVIVGIEEGIQATVPFETAPINGSVYGQLYAEANAFTLSSRISYPTGSDRFLYDFSTATSSQASAVATDSVTPTTSNWTIQSKTGPAPPAQSTGRAATDAVASDRLIESGRITLNEVTDEEPALASTSDGFRLVWSRQDPNKSALNGRDIYTARDSGSGYSSSTPLTDDNRSDFSPSVAGTDTGETLAAFTTLDRHFEPANVTSPADMYPYSEIRIARMNSTDWTEPVFLTKNDAFDYNPQVVAHDGAWTVAWTRDTDQNLSTWRDRSVHYVRVDANGSVGQVQSIPDARVPQLTTGPSGAPRLAAFEMDGAATNGTIVSRTVTDSGQQHAAIPVTQLTGLAAANETLAWTTAASDTWVTTSRNGTQQSLTAPPNVTAPQSISLTARENRLLLEFRAITGRQSVSQVYYQPRVDGEWLDARQYANGSAANITYWQTSTVGTSDGFRSVAAGKALGTTQKHDLYGFESAFRPDLTVTIRNTSTARVGESVTVNYTVSNTGDWNSSETTVSVANGSEIATTQTVPSLAPGERTNGSATVIVDSSGQVGLEVDPTGSVVEHAETNNRATITLQRPDLAVAPFDVVGNNTTVTVTAPIRNPTNVTAPPVPYRFSASPNRTLRGTVPSVPPNKTVRLNWSFDRTALNSSYPVELHVDPAGELDEVADNNNFRSKTVLRPDIRVTADTVNYYRDDGQIIAAVSLANAGLRTGSGTVTIADPDTDSVVATGEFTIERARAATSPRFSTLDLALSDTVANDTVRVSVQSQIPNETTRTTQQSVVDTVRLNTTLRPPSGRIAANQSLLSPGQPIRFSAANVSDDDGSVVDYQWTATNATLRSNGSTAVVTPDTNASMSTISLLLTDDDGLSTRRTLTLSDDDPIGPIESVAFQTQVNNVGSPAHLSLIVSNGTDTLDIVTLTRDGDQRLSETDVPAQRSTQLQWVPEESTWNDTTGQYDRARLSVTVDTPDRNSTIPLRTKIYIAGDATGDGRVNLLDAVRIGRAYGETASTERAEAADLNNDGHVDITDAVILGRNWRTTAGHDRAATEIATSAINNRTVS